MFPSGHDRRDTAISWFVRLRNPDITEAERGEFQRWLQTDPANQEAFESVTALWEDLGDVIDRDAARAAPAASLLGSLAGRTASLFAGFGLRRLAAGAAAAVLLAMVVFYEHPGSETVPVERYASPISAPKTVELSDGSSIYLYENSAIEVQFSPQQRNVVLKRGACVFDVEHEAGRTFTVSTSHGIVKVVGTVFDVHTDRNQSTVTVLEGTVVVAFDDARDGPQFALQNGNKASYSRTGRMTAITPETRQHTPAITTSKDKLIYEDVALETVVSELNERFQRKIWIGNDRLKDVKVSAVLALDDENAVIKGMERAFDIKALPVSDNLIVFYPDH